MIRNLSLVLFVLGLHLILVYLSVLPGNFEGTKYIDLSLAFIFVLGFTIAYPAIKKGDENFAIRFLLITTLQMLLMLSLILILTFTKMNGIKTLGFSAITLFLILLGAQSFAFIRAVCRKRN